MYIREYQPEKDQPALFTCIDALQEFERTLVPSMPKGVEMRSAYYAEVLAKCDKYQGKILLAVEDNQVVGYATIYSQMLTDEIEEGIQAFAYIGDLLVLSGYRGRGYGRELVLRAQSIATENNATILRINVLAANTNARDLYQSLAFKPLYLGLTKDL